MYFPEDISANLFVYRQNLSNRVFDQQSFFISHLVTKTQTEWFKTIPNKLLSSDYSFKHCSIPLYLSLFCLLFPLFSFPHFIRSCFWLVLKFGSQKYQKYFQPQFFLNFTFSSCFYIGTWFETQSSFFGSVLELVPSFRTKKPKQAPSFNLHFQFLLLNWFSVWSSVPGLEPIQFKKKERLRAPFERFPKGNSSIAETRTTINPLPHAITIVSITRSIKQVHQQLTHLCIHYTFQNSVILNSEI